jgi:hypothetical protein
MARSAVTLEGFLAALDPDRRAQVEAVRALVRDAGPGLVEGVKWNAPSWSHDGTDRITVNTMNKARQVMLVLHMGAARPEDRSAPPVLDDPSGIVAWSSDIRGAIAFADLADVEAKAPAVQEILRRWLAIPV